MKFDEKKQLLIVAAFCGLIFCGEFAIGWGLKTDNNVISQVLSDLDSREASAQEKIARIPQMKDKARSLSRIVSEYTAILPEKDEVRRDAFVDTITALCRDSGLTILVAEPLQVLKKGTAVRGRKKAEVVAEKDPFTRHKYRFEMSGEFAQLHRFINSVENHPRFLRVDGIELFPSGDDNGLVSASEPIKRLAVVISTYVYDEPSVQMEAIQ
jgi:Tfp pilus assembly protein PilO